MPKNGEKYFISKKLQLNNRNKLRQKKKKTEFVNHNIKVHIVC